jgi:hypothetical protein
LLTGDHFCSFNHVQHPITNTPAQLFKQVLAGPAKLTYEHADALQALLLSFPQSGLLRALQARSGMQAHVSAAAAWFGDNVTLQKIVQGPHMLQAVTPAQVIVQRKKPAPQPVEPEPEQAIVIDEDADHQNDNYYQLIDRGEAKGKQTSLADEDQMPGDLRGGKNFGRFREQQNGDTEKLIYENMAANDYFVFDRAFAEREQDTSYNALRAEEKARAQENYTPSQPLTNQTQQGTEEGGITRYHDDKMPYSFMWWLDKTRNKHSGVYQPFARPAPQPDPTPSQPPVQETLSKEENEIIERFIEQPPQPVKPPAADKMDASNQAKASTEDQEDLITETLARIYADQMLFSKAIAAYKILMLKNPEKRRYFADQIENLEKKIN